MYLPSQLEVVRKKLPSAPSSAASATRPLLMSESAHTAELHPASTWGGLASAPLRPRPVERSSQWQQRRLGSLANNSDSTGDCATEGTAPLTAPRDQRSGCLAEISGTHRFCWPGVVLLATVITQASPTEHCSSQPLPNSSLCDDSSRTALTLALTSCSNLLDAGLRPAVWARSQAARAQQAGPASWWARARAAPCPGSHRGIGVCRQEQPRGRAKRVVHRRGRRNSNVRPYIDMGRARHHRPAESREGRSVSLHF